MHTENQYKFIYLYDYDYGKDEQVIEHRVSNKETIDDVVNAFGHFLLGCGFHHDNVNSYLNSSYFNKESISEKTLYDVKPINTNKPTCIGYNEGYPTDGGGPYPVKM